MRDSYNSVLSLTRNFVEQHKPSRIKYNESSTAGLSQYDSHFAIQNFIQLKRQREIQCPLIHLDQSISEKNVIYFFSTILAPSNDVYDSCS